MLENIVDLLISGERDKIELAYQLSIANKISLWPIERNFKDLLYYSNRIQPPISFDNLPLGQLCYISKEVIAIQICHQTIRQLPDCFNMLPSLVILEIACPELNQLGKSIEHLKHLKSLSIKHSKLEQLTFEVCKMHRLESLNISFNCQLRQLPKDIYASKSLKKLSICAQNEHLIDKRKASFEIVICR